MDRLKLSIRVGISADSPKFDLVMQKTDTVKKLRDEIATSPTVQCLPEQVIMVFNGSRLNIDSMGDFKLANLGFTDDSMVIVIISKSGGKVAKEQENIGLTKDQQKKDADLTEALTATFDSRPFGFAVWANASGRNAIVTKVAKENALKLGIKIGYVVWKCNGESLFGRPHDEALGKLKNTPCPLDLTFADLGTEYQPVFKQKPLGFTVIQDREEKNAKVSKINTSKAQQMGIMIGSYIVKINDTECFGWKHKEIIKTINKAKFPLKLTLRHPPPLLMVAGSRSKKK